MKTIKLRAKGAFTGTVSILALLFSTACTDTFNNQRVSTQSSLIGTASSQVSQSLDRVETSYSIASISDIYSLWNRNQVAAIDKYNGKAMQITGVVNGIYNDGAGRLEIEDRNDWSGLGITCKIDSSQRSTLGSLSHGDSVTVHGKLKLINGMFDSREIEMRHCIIGSARNIRNESPTATARADRAYSSNFLEGFQSTQSNSLKSQYSQPVVPNGKAFFKSGRTGKEKLIGVSLSSRVNANGHTVYDAAWSDDFQSSYVFWTNGHVEIFSEDGSGATVRTAAKFQRLSNGSIQIIAETDSVTVFPSFNPATN